MTEEEKEALKLASTINAVKSAQEASGEKIASMERAIADVTAIQRTQQQLMEANARLATEQKAGTRGDLGSYVAKTVDASVKSHYRVTDAGAIRLTGANHDRVLPTGDVVRSWQFGLLDDPAPKSPEQLELQRAVTRRSVARMAMAPAVGTSLAGWRPYTPSLDAAVIEAGRACGGQIEKIFSDSAGIGAEWIPDTYVPELDRAVIVPTGFNGLFPQRVLTPGGSKIPSISGNLRLYKHSAPSADDPSNATLSSMVTGNTQVDPIASVVAVQIDRDSAEDAIIAVIPELMQHIMNAIQFARDDSDVNGDTTASHQDTIATWNTRGRLGTTNLGGTNDHRRRWLGLRPRAYDLTSMTTDQNGSQNWVGLQTAIGKVSAENLITAHSDPTSGNVVIAPSWEYFFAKMLEFSEFISFDKVGALATVLTGKLGGMGPGGMLPGQVGFVKGFLPVVIPYTLTADLASSGLYTGSGSTTGMLVFDRSRFEYCIRQGIQVESAIDIRSNTTNLVARVRDVLRAKDAVASTVKDTHFSYNLTY